MSGLALIVAACASQPFSSGESASRGSKDAMSRVADIIGAITDNYVDPVERVALVNACWRALPAPVGASEQPAENVGEHSLHDVAGVLSRLSPEDADAAADACARSMLASLGGRSEFLDVYDFRDLKGTAGAPGAIGLNLAPAAEGAKIVGAIEGTPADSAAIVPGDLLTTIDDVDLRGRPLKDIIHRLRGEVGSAVTITIQRDGQAAPLRLTLIRQKLRLKLEGHLLEPGFVLLKTSQLNLATPNDLTQTVARLRRDSNDKIRGIVLDLRDCSGGLLIEAVALSAAFLPPGTLVTETRGRAPDSNRRYSADARDYGEAHGRDPIADLPPEFKSAPMVVLIGPKTASGAEIVASALKDNKRATLVGQRSFGEGTIETIIPLRGKGTGIKITTARVYRASGEELQGKGLKPDVVVEQPAQPGDRASAGDRAVTQALEILKSDSSARR